MVRRELKEDKIVTALRTDEHDPLSKKSVKKKTYIGYLGKSDIEGFWRIYSSPSLDDYREFAEDDIIATYSLETPSNPFGGTIVWINGSATVKTVRTTPKDEGSFLMGDITDKFQFNTTLGMVEDPEGITTTLTPLVTWCLRSNTCTRRICPY